MSKQLVVERGRFDAPPSMAYVDPDHEVRIVYGKKPWFEIPSYDAAWCGQATIYLPIRGWQDQQWCDGPIIHWDKDGLIVNWVDVGLPVRLSLDCQEQGRSEYEARAPDWRAAKQTLAEAILNRHTSESGFYIDDVSGDLKDALLLVALRFAVRDRFLRADEMPPGENAPIWRRLLQNIGILHGRAPQQQAGAMRIRLSTLRSMIPDALVQNLAASCNASGHIIPPKLFSP